MAIYVQAKGSDDWHWCKNCRKYPYPQNIAKTTQIRPIGYLCDECRQHEAAGNCRTA